LLKIMAPEDWIGPLYMLLGNCFLLAMNSYFLEKFIASYLYTLLQLWSNEFQKVGIHCWIVAVKCSDLIVSFTLKQYSSQFKAVQYERFSLELEF
jgi:hypothetical protein